MKFLEAVIKASQGHAICREGWDDPLEMGGPFDLFWRGTGKKVRIHECSFDEFISEDDFAADDWKIWEEIKHEDSSH